MPLFLLLRKEQACNLRKRRDDSGPHISDDQFIMNLDEVEKRHILKILEKTDLKIDDSKGAAVLLDLHPNTLRARMQKLGISLKKVSA